MCRCDSFAQLSVAILCLLGGSWKTGDERKVGYVLYFVFFPAQFREIRLLGEGMCVFLTIAGFCLSCKFNCSLKGTQNHTRACSDETPNDFQHLIYCHSLSYTGTCVRIGQR